MSLKNWQYDAIMRKYNNMQIHNKHVQDDHVRYAYGKIPKLAEIDRQIVDAGIERARYLLGMKGDTIEQDYKAYVAMKSEEKKSLLVAYGLPEDYLEMPYNCEKCKDTGYIGDHKCSCFEKKVMILLYEQSNMIEDFEDENFKKLSYNYYKKDVLDENTGMSEYEMAKYAVKECLDFIRDFDTDNKSLFFYGSTGMGKTFLSHCIAKELMDTGHSVAFFSAHDLFRKLADEAFDREHGVSIRELALDCDLLILDDLGTELNNAFVSSRLFYLISDRLSKRRSTIISTNLEIQDFIEQYSERTFSRLSSAFLMLKLMGKDIRIQKKIERRKGQHER